MKRKLAGKAYTTLPATKRPKGEMTLRDKATGSWCTYHPAELEHRIYRRGSVYTRIHARNLTEAQAAFWAAMTDRTHIP